MKRASSVSFGHLVSQRVRRALGPVDPLLSREVFGASIFTHIMLMFLALGVWWLIYSSNTESEVLELKVQLEAEPDAGAGDAYRDWTYEAARTERIGIRLIGPRERVRKTREMLASDSVHLTYRYKLSGTNIGRPDDQGVYVLQLRLRDFELTNRSLVPEEVELQLADSERAVQIKFQQKPAPKPDTPNPESAAPKPPGGG